MYAIIITNSIIGNDNSEESDETDNSEFHDELWFCLLLLRVRVFYLRTFTQPDTCVISHFQVHRNFMYAKYIYNKMVSRQLYHALPTVLSRIDWYTMRAAARLKFSFTRMLMNFVNNNKLTFCSSPGGFGTISWSDTGSVWVLQPVLHEVASKRIDSWQTPTRGALFLLHRTPCASS